MSGIKTRPVGDARQSIMGVEAENPHRRRFTELSFRGNCKRMEVAERRYTKRIPVVACPHFFQLPVDR